MFLRMNLKVKKEEGARSSAVVNWHSSTEGSETVLIYLSKSGPAKSRNIIKSALCCNKHASAFASQLSNMDKTLYEVIQINMSIVSMFG